jgi:hypothetical protein
MARRAHRQRQHFNLTGCGNISSSMPEIEAIDAV